MTSPALATNVATRSPRRSRRRLRTRPLVNGEREAKPAFGEPQTGRAMPDDEGEPAPWIYALCGEFVMPRRGDLPAVGCATLWHPRRSGRVAEGGALLRR